MNDDYLSAYSYSPSKNTYLWDSPQPLPKFFNDDSTTLITSSGSNSERNSAEISDGESIKVGITLLGNKGFSNYAPVLGDPFTAEVDNLEGPDQLNQPQHLFGMTNDLPPISLLTDQLEGEEEYDPDGYMFDNVVVTRLYVPVIPPRKRPRSSLADEYLTKCLPGDDEYDSLVNEYLLPFCTLNYLSIADIQGVEVEQDNIVYERNVKSNLPEKEEEGTGRMTGDQGTNFYEPKVFRSHPVQEFKKQGRDGLCPYCKVEGGNLDEIFFNMNSSSYLHHVTKQHGVYSNGSEMPLPKEIGSIEETKVMRSGIKKSTVQAVTCPICEERVKIQKLEGMDEKNRFLGYFRHMLGHNLTKRRNCER